MAESQELLGGYGNVISDCFVLRLELLGIDSHSEPILLGITYPNELL